MKNGILALAWLAGSVLLAEGPRGVVTFNGLPVPGATVTARQGSASQAAVTDARGVYELPELAAGAWTVEVRLALFQPARREVQVPAPAEAWQFALEPAPVSAVAPVKSGFQKTAVAAVAAPAAAPAKPAQTAENQAELAQRAADGLLVNGSVNNGAASVFAQLPAFGNNRKSGHSLYNGNLGLVLRNAALDARSFSLTGQETPKPAYSRIQGLFSFGGPMKIPGLLKRNGPLFSVNYQWTRNTNARTEAGLMPTAAERTGDLSASPRAVLDALTGAPLPANKVPAARLSAQALALLTLYPAPNFQNGRFNYQIPVTNHLHQDDLQARANKQVRRNFYSGQVAWQSVRTDTPSLLGLLDTGRTNGVNAGGSYRRSFSPRAFTTVGVQYSRMTNRVTPYFAGRRDVAGEAGIQGVSTDSRDWGAPNLQFAGGLTGLAAPQSSLLRNQTLGVQVDSFLSRGRHYLTYGGGHRWQQFNSLGQQEARGSFSFTGAAAGTDLGGFLQGYSDAASVAFGNADKYLRASIDEAYLSDDWRVSPGLTLNLGLRWESWSPAREKYGRLVNLAAAQGFGSVRPALGDEAVLGRTWSNLGPRVAFSWRPLAASSLVVRGGFGTYFDTSVYEPLARQMAQQVPLSRSARVSGVLPMATALQTAPAGTALFGVAPEFRPGASNSWQVSVQRDLPWALQAVAAYDGSRGLHGQRTSLPNTYAPGGVAACAACPVGFSWLDSEGGSRRDALRLQLRRRLRAGLAASVTYTLAKSTDDAASGGRGQAGSLVAQNWLDWGAERARSNFDQRQVVSATVQYTSGMGLRGGALAGGWRGRLLKDWTIGTTLNGSTGTPLNPVYPGATPGSGVTGLLRPDFTGADPYAAANGLHLNPAAVAAPAAGRWGNAGRNSLQGPGQFTMNGSLGRTFRGTDRISLDVRLDAENALNQVTYPSWNAVVGSAQFGLPVTANAMRTVQLALRARF